MTDLPLDDILDTLVTGVIRLARDGSVTWINPAAADLLETSPKHARGRSLRELAPADEYLEGFVQRALANGEPLAVAELDLTCGPPPGRHRTVTCDILPLDNHEVQIELHALDRRLAIAEDGVSLHNHHAQRLLFQALAHEIKNPLSGLRGAAQLLAAEANEHVPQDYLDVMLRETDRLRELVDGLLGPARATRFADVNIHAILEHVRTLLGVELPDTITWERDYDPSLPDFRADPDQLTQVFINLASNAIEAMQGSGKLRMRTRIERHFVRGRRHRMALRIDVEDNGPGVPADMRASLFLPLVTSRAEGTGLGLSIVQDLVHRHHGVIEWHSEPGRTVFSVILPLHADIDERGNPYA